MRFGYGAPFILDSKMPKLGRLVSGARDTLWSTLRLSCLGERRFATIFCLQGFWVVEVAFRSNYKLCIYVYIYIHCIFLMYV